MKHLIMTLTALVVALPAAAQQYTTAAEVRPILDATRGKWVAVREYDGKDLLYFTNLLAWRCGVDTISYMINGGGLTRLDSEPCHEDEAVPNALKSNDIMPFISQPLGSIDTVEIRLLYDDGSTDSASYQRKNIMTP
ncbi:MAG: hypothetical protein P8X50_07770 [Maritimibacter sp.]|jgi:hypothetical protein